VPQHVVLTHDVAPQQRAHPRGELVEAERLRQVIIGACV